MRWPIRHQMLFPFAAVVLLAVTALTIVAAALAARRSDQQTQSRLHSTLETLDQTRVPYTAAVLDKVRGLSGAHLIARDAAGAVVASTLPDLERLPEGLATGLSEGSLASLTARPAALVGGERYFVARIVPRGDPSVSALYVLYPVERWSSDQRAAALLPVMVGGPALVLTAAVAFWLSHRFSRRLRALQSRVADIASGDFQEIPVSGRDDEVRDVFGSVNRLAGELARMQQTIRRTERTRLLAQLASGLAHQLRNAVTGTRMAVQLHQRRCRPQPGDRSLDVALRQLELTEAQVRGLLSLGRSEARPAAPCRVAELCAEVESLLEPACAHARVSLTVAAAGGQTTVLADREALRAALLNLALNGVEAAGPGGEVTLTYAERSRRAVLTVRDNGPGPPAAVREALFEPFVTGRSEGVGLGLALSRQVAVDHGGELTWRREGEWTAFELSLPASSPAARGDDGEQAENHDAAPAICAALPEALP